MTVLIGWLVATAGAVVGFNLANDGNPLGWIVLLVTAAFVGSAIRDSLY